MTTLAGPVARIGRWVLFVVVMWFVLRPVLTISITYDDYINPFRLRLELGSNPLHIVAETIRGLNANGHFNYIGQSLGALVYVGYERLMGVGVRYTTMYALTKLAVFVLAVTAAGKLLRVLLELLGRSWSAWRARLAVAVLLVATMQLHVPWSYDPVGSFALWGYLATAVGFGALIVAVPILSGSSTRPSWWGAAALCLSILYYEINVAMVAALVPIGVLLLRRLDDPSDRRALIRRAAALMVPPTAMSIVLMLWARHANQGYEGTQAGLGAGGLGNLVHTLGSSFPTASWVTARDWLDTTPTPTAWVVVSAVIVGATIVVLVARRPRSPESPVPVADALLVAASMLTVWLVTSLVQGATPKVNDQSSGFAQVYMYYAFGSLALPMAAVLGLQAWRGARWWNTWTRGVALAVVIAFALVQLTVNDNVQRSFDERYPGLDQVLDTFADQAPEAERCAAIHAFESSVWVQLFPSMWGATSRLYQSHHGVPFCGETGTEIPP